MNLRRIFPLFLFAFVLMTPTQRLHAQPDLTKRISLDVHGVPLEEVLKSVAGHYSLTLWYSESVLPAKLRVSSTLENATLHEAMEAVLKGTSLSYVIADRTTLIITTSRKVGEDTGILIGKVIDRVTKQPIPYANVVLVGSTRGGSTDLEGKFRIADVEENVYGVKCSSVGYESRIETDIRVIRGKTTIVRDIELSEAVVAADSVVVTAGYFFNDKMTPTTIYSYNREEIQRNPGSQGDIFRAIETFPGVGGSGGEFSAFSVRGSSPRDNIILVDNIPFDKVAHLVSGSEEDEAQGGRYSVFTPGVINGADFQAGGFSSRYGGKFSSVLDLKIKEGNNESFTANGSYDLYGWEVNYDGPAYVAGKSSLLLSARHHDFARVLDLIGRKDLGQTDLSDVVVKLTSDISADQKLSLIGLYAPEHFDRSVENVLKAKNDDIGTFIGSVEETKYLLGGNWRYLTGSSSFWENTFYYKQTDNHGRSGRAYVTLVNGAVSTGTPIPTRPEYVRSDHRDVQVGMKSQFTMTPSAVSTILVGGEFYLQKYDFAFAQDGLDTLYEFDRDDYRPDTSKEYVIADPANVQSTKSGSTWNTAAFIDYRLDATNRLVVQPGIRFEYSDFDKRQYILPRFGMSYQIDDRTNFHGAAGLYCQPPDPKFYLLTTGNAALKDEWALHFVLGVSQYLTDNVKLTVEIYRKELWDLVVHPDRTTPVRTNAGTGFARGFDIGLVKKLSDQWYGQINYSYAESRRDDHDGRGVYDAEFNQPHIFNILAGFELNKEWSFAAKWKFATGRPRNSYIIHSDIFHSVGFMRYSKENTGRNDSRYGNFQTLNIRIDYRKQFGDVPVIDNLAIVAFLDILNVFGYPNTNSEEFRELNGRVLTMGVGMLPTLGVKIEF